MQTHITTTPFGRRPVTLGQISTQMAAKAAKPEAVAHKWKVFQDIRDARDLLGATDRSLAILNALLTFHPETALTGDGDLIVWPSNEQLAARANGISPATLRRHIAILVACGLVIRRDSPNGKRFARKGRGGEIEQAYGFDLMPIVARAEELRDLAEAVRAEKKAFRVAKERLTLLRRDVVKSIETGLDESVPGPWGRIQQAYRTIIGRLPRAAPRELINEICSDLLALYTESREILESFAKSKNPSANESQFERHKQNSKPEPSSESENGEPNEAEASGSVAESDNIRSFPERELPLGIVLDACPGVRDLAQGHEIRQWRDFLAAVELVRPMLGISASAWRDAREALGAQHAAITLAAIYQRADQINNPGGYLRSLTERARDGKFSTWPMIMALLRAKLDAQKAAAVDGAKEDFGVALDAPRIQASEALLRSLNKPKR